MLRDRGSRRIATAGADAEQPDRAVGDEGQRLEEIDRAANVLNARGGILQIAGQAAALPWCEGSNASATIPAAASRSP